MQQDTELDEVLRHLGGADLYRNNVFRLTGLPTDASATLIRRRREEAALLAQLGGTLPVDPGNLPLPSAPEDTAVKAAFEALRNPVLRIVHELLWLWGEPGAHDDAVRAHCAALEGESIAAPGRPEIVGDPLTPVWSAALASWASVLSTDAIWDRARTRVQEIDDPRLTTGTVRRLRDRLPRHIVDVSISLAVRAADEFGVEAADRHIWLLDESPFDVDLVDGALRDAARPAEERVRTACVTASEAAASTPKKATAAVEELFRRAAPALPVLATLLGEDDPITTAASDEVAKAANLCAIGYYNATQKVDSTLAMLAKAQELATDTATIELLNRNEQVVTEERISGKVKELCTAGRVNAAAARLRAWRTRTDNPVLHEQIDAVLADPRALRAPLGAGPPMQFAIFGFGARLYGRRSFPAEKEMYVTTHFITFLFFPVIPLAAYLRKGGYIYGKVPLSTFTRWWRRIAPSLLAVWITWANAGAVAGPIVVGIVAVVTIMVLLWRESRVIDWVNSVSDE